MLTLTDRDAVRLAARDPTIDRHVRAVLRLRFEQLGGVGANFHVVEAGDTNADAEAAVGWPMAFDGAPQWEWAARHPGGVVELTFVLSDDGPAEVLLVPDLPGIDPMLLELCRQHA